MHINLYIRVLRRGAGVENLDVGPERQNGLSKSKFATRSAFLFSFIRRMHTYKTWTRPRLRQSWWDHPNYAYCSCIMAPVDCILPGALYLGR